MGEARRRKLAGTYGDADPPVAAEHFRAPEGTVALTFDVEGASPSTCVLAAGGIVDVLDKVAQVFAKVPYRPLVRRIAADFLKARLGGDDNALSWIAPVALWAALHHPDAGAVMRAGVSDNLRRCGKAHITWQYGPKGLAIALADGFVDLEGLTQIAPEDGVLVYGVQSDDPIGSTH
jgi:hypothetical protein